MKISKNILLLPNTFIDVYKLLIESGRTDKNALNTIDITGIKSVTKVNEMLLTEFIFQGLLSITSSDSDFFTGVDSVIVVAQSYDQRIPSVSSRIQSKLGLINEAFCIDIMDGCSGYIKALSITDMLFSRGYKKTLIVAGDLNSTMTAESEIGARILFGDGISISIIENDNQNLKPLLLNDGDHKNTISCPIKNPQLIMNGFEVFRFTKNKVPKLINNYLNDIDKSINDFDLLALHQASDLVVSTICKNLNYTNQLCDDFSCGDFGNIGAGSIGAWLSNLGKIQGGKDLKMLAVGFGSGLSWGVASLVVNLEVNKVIYVKC